MIRGLPALKQVKEQEAVGGNLASTLAVFQSVFQIARNGGILSENASPDSGLWV
jgi:hypothetical protein